MDLKALYDWAVGALISNWLSFVEWVATVVTKENSQVFMEWLLCTVMLYVAVMCIFRMSRMASALKARNLTVRKWPWRSFIVLAGTVCVSTGIATSRASWAFNRSLIPEYGFQNWWYDLRLWYVVPPSLLAILGCGLWLFSAVSDITGKGNELPLMLKTLAALVGVSLLITYLTV